MVPFHHDPEHATLSHPLDELLARTRPAMPVSAGYKGEVRSSRSDAYTPRRRRTASRRRSDSGMPTKTPAPR